MESILLTYSKADESRLMAFLQNLKSVSMQRLVPVASNAPDGDAYTPPTREERMQGLAAGIMEINADIRGEKEMKTFNQLLIEINEAEYAD
jgi:hypothetical protein